MDCGICVHIFDGDGGCFQTPPGTVLGHEFEGVVEPVACCVHGIDMCNISCGDTVAVIGGGMIGMIMLQLAKISGAGKLIMIEPVAAKREIAKNWAQACALTP